MKRFLPLGLVAVLAMAAAPNVIDNVQRIMKAGFQAGPATTLTSTANRVTAMLAVDVDYDFGEVDGGCLDSAAATLTGAKRGDPCFVGIGPGDGGTAVVTSNATFTCYASATNAVKLRFCAPLAGAGYTVNPADAGYQLRVISNR